MLLIATSFWGTTFLLMKALGLCQQQLIPGAGTWFSASASLLARFGLGALVLLALSPRSLATVTRSELTLGAGLGLLGGIGLIFQMDGVQHTPASTSAFLTQCYCIIIPAFVALRKREWPAIPLIASCLMIMAGVGVLADLKWGQLRLGRGEAETIMASIIFAAQILWLERPCYTGTRSGPVTLVMFITVSLTVAPIVWSTCIRPTDLLRAYSTIPTLGIIIYLTVACTIVSFTLMNRWQRHISATHASLIYCSEPLFASVSALFVPAFISGVAKIEYPNELLTTRLLWGGGLITAANIMVFWHASRLPKTGSQGIAPTAPAQKTETLALKS